MQDGFNIPPIAFVSFDSDAEGILDPVRLIGILCVTQCIGDQGCERPNIGLVQLENIWVLRVSINNLVEPVGHLPVTVLDSGDDCPTAGRIQADHFIGPALCGNRCSKERPMPHRKVEGRL